MGAKAGLAQWHKVIAGGSEPAALAAPIHEDAVFHSPFAHTPQRACGRLSRRRQANAGQCRLPLHPRAGRRENAFLESETELDGIHINGIDLIRFDADGMIADFKVMLRPLRR